MTINKQTNGNELVVALEGRLDTTTAPELEEQLVELTGITKIIFSFEKLEYISSAGLRVLLSSYKKMHAVGGELVIKGANDTIKEIFDITGLSDLLTIE